MKQSYIYSINYLVSNLVLKQKKKKETIKFIILKNKKVAISKSIVYFV